MKNNILPLLPPVVKQIDLGKYSKIKSGPMHFTLSAYELEGGHRVCFISLKAMLGMMKMESAIYIPYGLDLPFINADWVKAMGNETLVLEGYKTCEADVEMPGFDQLVQKYACIPDHHMSEHWYDSLHASFCVCKRSKKHNKEMMQYILDWVASFMQMEKEAAPFDVTKQKELVYQYTYGLINNGGPATDQFVKMLGKEATEDLFYHYLFACK